MMQIRIMRSAGVMAVIHVATLALLSSLVDAQVAESNRIVISVRGGERS
jgi:hypothetical protein